MPPRGVYKARQQESRNRPSRPAQESRSDQKEQERQEKENARKALAELKAGGPYHTADDIERALITIGMK